MTEKQPHGSSVLHADCRRDVFRLFMIVWLVLHRCMGKTSLHGYVAIYCIAQTVNVTT